MIKFHILQRTRFLWLMLFSFFIISVKGKTQSLLYRNEFPLEDVILLKGPFQHARDLNIKVLLEYDVNRLLAPFLKEAGLTPKGRLYPNWEGLDGHIGGHYLTALAMNFAATGNEECKRRMEYMISELGECQRNNGLIYADWGKGYIGGVPNSRNIWRSLMNGDFRAYRSAWVPWYNVHKMYAGLRDAWMYAGNQEARELFLKFCDWGINITSRLSDEQMQSMLDTEHGGMNEIFADAYQMTGDDKYLIAAKRFSHRMLLDAMAAGNDNLDNKHANTQVPKAIGFARIAELSADNTYIRAGNFFWETVTRNRSLAFGGNSRREHFPAASACIDFVNEVEGPESCNSYNMLRLTEILFRMNPSAGLADYYERTLFNHILSTQHPEHGGYVYFTSARPRHYRVYSSPNEAMWCCVGSGMENHGKYNQFIYTRCGDSLFLNLFIASELNWKEKGITLRQETKFPDEEQTQLRITKGKSRFVLMIRHPSWIREEALKVLVNGRPVKFKSPPSSYVAVDRVWKKGDRITVLLPMYTYTESIPNVPEYVAFLHGPVLLAAKTGTEDLKGLIADDSRWGHIAGGKRLPVSEAPVLIADNISEIAGNLMRTKENTMTFTFPAGMKMINAAEFQLEPFARIHDSRYIMYWMTLTTEKSRRYLDSLAIAEKEKLELQGRTVDFVAPGEQQPEADHKMEQSGSNTGNYLDEFWRNARNGGYFSYSLATNSQTDLKLMVRYWGAERGERKFDIYIDDEKLISEDNTGRWNQERFMETTYEIPETMLRGKNYIRVRFQAQPGASTSQVFYVRLVRGK